MTSPIVGMNSIQRVDESIVSGELTDDEAGYLEEPYVPLLMCIDIFVSRTTRYQPKAIRGFGG